MINLITRRNKIEIKEATKKPTNEMIPMVRTISANMFNSMKTLGLSLGDRQYPSTFTVLSNKNIL